MYTIHTTGAVRADSISISDSMARDTPARRQAQHLILLGSVRLAGRALVGCRDIVTVVAALGRLERLLVHDVGAATVVARVDLGDDLHLRVLRHKLGGDRHALFNLDARGHDGVVLHVRHGDELVDLRDAKPVERIRHERLEASVHNAGHVLRAVEVLLGGVAVLLALAAVVHEVLGNLAEGAALLTVVDDDASAASLGRLHALLHGVGEVRAAGADVRSEHVRAIALVVHAHG
mmetsp:Transcript_29329/g.94042  ORF Transcript_29329/g.94042 Transcript_29329/m.94042 type:complete len:234 (-) Transcript_29329:916-1617(-)